MILLLLQKTKQNETIFSQIEELEKGLHKLSEKDLKCFLLTRAVGCNIRMTEKFADTKKGSKLSLHKISSNTKPPEQYS